MIEHVLSGRVQGPVISLAQVSRFPRDLDEAVVKGEIVPDAVLPDGKSLTIVRKFGSDEVTDI